MLTRSNPASRRLSYVPSPHPVPRAARRGVLAAGAAAGAAPFALGAATAAAAGGYRPATYDEIPLLSRRERHLVSRFSYGITPELAADVPPATRTRCEPT